MEQTVDLCEQLAQTDLSEDDTTLLLKEASDLNKKLKAELKRIEERGQRAGKLQRTSNTSTGDLKPSRPSMSTKSTLEKHKTFLPPISSSPSKSHRVLGAQASPYASIKTNNKRKGVARQSTDRQSNSAGNATISPSTSKKLPTKTTKRKTSRSVEDLRTARTLPNSS